MANLNPNVFKLPSLHHKNQSFMNQMIQLSNRADQSKDFILANKEDSSIRIKVDLFVLMARSDFFKSLADSPMLESQNFTSSFTLSILDGNKTVSLEIFKIFVKYLYYGETAFNAVGNGINLRVQDALFLCECVEFYAMGRDPLKTIAEQRMRRSLDRHTVLYDLQLANTIQATKIKRVCIEYILDHFDLLVDASGLE